MKIRNGFVSNSSSSSFCIYGTSISRYDAKNKLKLLDKFKDLDEDDIDILEKLEELFKDNKGIEIEDGAGDFSDIYIGSSWAAIKDDETGLQFKERIKETVTKVLVDNALKFSTYEEAWYNG